jgi:DNA-binding response OmpR family regulator
MNTLTTSDHLLVIDPCSDTQARIAEQLQGRGFSVVAASDLTTALTMIDMAAPDIVITDLFLPEATGLTVVKELKARHELCPVIVMAKDAPEPMIIQALRIGAADYLHSTDVATRSESHARRSRRYSWSLPSGISTDCRLRPNAYSSDDFLAPQDDGLDPASCPTVASSGSPARTAL